MKEQLKYLEKNIPGLQQMGMQFMALGSQEELREQILNAGLERAFLQDPLPRNADEFNRRRDEGKARLGLLVNEIARLCGQVLAEYHALPKKLQGIKAHAAAAADMQAQLRNWWASASWRRRITAAQPLSALPEGHQRAAGQAARRSGPRYAAAGGWNSVACLPARPEGPRRPGRSQDDRVPLDAGGTARVAVCAGTATPMPVSVKRLQKVWESMQR
jgi:ATP-dependent helicase HrpA